MKRLNEYKRITKAIFTKMLEEAKKGLRTFEIVSSYKYTEYCNDTHQVKNSIMSIEKMDYLIKDLEMFSFIQLRVQSNGNLDIYYHSNEFLTIKEVETKEKKETIQFVETIEEVKQETTQEIALEEIKEEITTSEEVEEIETTISFKTAENAFRNISFTPEDRAKSIIASSNKEIKIFLDDLLELAPNEKENIIADVKEWALKYDNKKTMWLDAMSRTASSAITGGANFTVERNRKRMEIAHNRNMELLEWLENSKKSLIKKYSPKPKVKTIFEEVEEVKKADRKGYFKQLDKESLTAKLFNYASISKENLEEVKEIAIKETSLFTSKHKIHRIIENLEKKYTRILEGTSNKEIEINGIKIVDSEENNRIELYFEGIPSADIRNQLKSKGFKWSPTKKAWQNFRNNQRLIEIKKYIETIGA